MATKTVYHSELKKLSPVRVTVKSDFIESTKRKGTYYIILEIDGEDRYYTPENQQGFDFFEGRKDTTFTLIAEGGGKGKEESASLQYVGESPNAGNPRPSPKQAGPGPRRGGGGGHPPSHDTTRSQGQAPAPTPSNRPQTSGASPQLGARVGMALNKAVDSCLQEGIPWNPEEIMNRASDLCRIAEGLEKGHLMPRFTERMRAQQGQEQGAE